MHDDTSQPPFQPPPRRPPPSPRFPLLMVLLVVLLAFWLLPPFVTSWVEQWEYAAERGRQRAEVESARSELSAHRLDDISRAFADIAKAIGPSVVHIDTVQKVSGPSDDLSAMFFGPEREYEAQAQGSGVIVDTEGYILTNYHVVQGAQQMSVKLSDGRSMPATPIGADPATDLAVIKIAADGLIAAEWGDSTTLPVGSLVWAVGNPYGLDRSITFGIISAKGRRGVGETASQDFLQTDAAVNPGNSGGPLVDVNAKIIGINTAILGRTNQGIGFSIPSELAREIYDKLKADGAVVRGWLGVQLPRQELSPEAAKELGLKDTRGALILGVVPNSPADKAGLKKGDFIVEWKKQPVENPNHLRMLVARAPINSHVPISVMRDGKPIALDVLIEQPETAHK